MSGFDYFHEGDILDYPFYRLPKLLFTDSRFEELSMGAKVLYCVLLDRLSLSNKNGWIDAEGRIFIFYTVEHLQELLKVSHTTVIKWLCELDVREGIGLIERFRKGFNKPSTIYVKNFEKDNKSIQNDGAQNVMCCSTESVVQKVEVHKYKNCTSIPKESGSSYLKKLEPSNTNISDTDINNTNINTPCRKAKLKALGRFENVSLTEKELSRLKQDYPYEYDNLIDRLSDYMASTGKRYKNHYATICLWAEKDKKDSNAVVYKFEEGECL